MKVPPVVGEVLHHLPAGFHRLIPPGVRADLRYRLGRSLPGDIDFVPGPPRAAAGEGVGPPDVVVLGSDAGGRRLFRLVAAHPGVARPRSPGDASSYFSRFCTSEFGAADIAEFHRWFPRRLGQITVHRSDDGLAYPWVVPLLAEAAPAARLVVLVRDPIDRLQFGLAHSAEQGSAHVGSYLADAVDRGRYGAHLARVLELFPPEQVLVVQFERWTADFDAELARVYRFAGLDASFRPSTGGHNAVVVPPALDPEVLSRLEQFYGPDVELLLDMVPELDLSLWPHFHLS